MRTWKDGGVERNKWPIFNPSFYGANLNQVCGVEVMEQSLIGQEAAVRLLQALCFVWVGLVAGISFLEAPVKFTAPSVTRAIGLDVGRHVFWALNRVELGLAAGALGLLLIGQPGGLVRWVAAGVGIILAIQTLWLLPVLRSQAAAIISGEIEHASEYVHLGYIVLEALKIAGLAVLGWQVTP